MRHKRWAALITALIVVAIGGILLRALGANWGSFVDSDQIIRSEGQAVVLEPGQTLGQTFVARHGGMNGVEIYLAPSLDAQATIVLHLREDPLGSADIRTAAVHLPEGSMEGFYRFPFPAISSSHSQYYYALLEHTGIDNVEAAMGAIHSYLDGTLYHEGQPQEAQAVFRLSYDPPHILLDLVTMVGGWLAFGLGALAVLFFSGYSLIRRWALRTGLDFTGTLIWSAVAALAAWLVFLVWASLVLKLTTWSVWLVVGGSCLAGLVLFVKDRERWLQRAYWLGPNPLSTLAFWAIVLLTIAIRLFVERGLVMFPGSDTYHHALIVQLFEEQGGIPRSYEPYTPLVSYSYHFGFHGIVALFRWLFQTELLTTTKTVAAVLNGAIAAIVGLVAEGWAGNRRAGVIAAATVGLIAVSPFALLRWGRFTQTAGLLFLAAGLLAVTASRENSGWAFPSLLIAGLATSHFRVVLLLILFVMLAMGIKMFQRQWNEVRDQLVLGVLSILLAAPWLLRVAWIQYDPHGLRPVFSAQGAANSLLRLETPVISFITNWPLLAVLVLCFAVVWYGRQTINKGRLVAIWILVSAAGTMIPSLLGIIVFLDATTTVLSMAVPLGILVGLSGEYLWNEFRAQGQTLARAGIVLVLLAGMIVGILYLPRLVQDGSLRPLRPADMRTMEWIEENIPDDALFLVNTIFIGWSRDWIVGIDAGYWVPLLAHRSTTVPPMIYPLEWGDPDKLPTLLEAMSDFQSPEQQATSPEGLILNRLPITHLLVDGRSESHALLELVETDRRLVEIFREDRFRVFEVVR